MRTTDPSFRCLCIALSIVLLSSETDVRAEGPYQPTWESLATYPIPDWFQDGKFGIYTHWGIYSVPAHITEWYPHGFAYYYNRAEAAGKQVAVTKKGEDLPAGVGILNFERGRAADILPTPWETDTSVYQNSWGYIKDVKYYTSNYLVDELIDIVSKNGVMLLNVGPKSDGTIPEQAQQVLLGMGRWLAVNGEAIYGTRPWKVFGEGPTKVGGGKRVRREADYTAQDIRFTTKGETLYAICLDWPGEELVIQSLGSESSLFEGTVADVKLVGHGKCLSFARQQRGLVVTMPKEKPSECAYVLKIVSK